MAIFGHLVRQSGQFKTTLLQGEGESVLWRVMAKKTNNQGLTSYTDHGGIILLVSPKISFMLLQTLR